MRFTVFDKKNTPALKQNIVTALLEDRAGSLWISTNGGGLIRLREGKFTAFTTKEGLTTDQVQPLYEDRGGSLWIGGWQGLNLFRHGKFTALTTKEGLSNDKVVSILGDREGSLWIGTRKGLDRLRNGNLTVITTKEGLSNDQVESIYEDREGSLWIGTMGGLNRFRDGKFTSFTTKDGLSNDQVFSICEDREGSLWIGTNGGGLNRFRDGKFTSYATKEGLSSDTVESIFEDREGSLWIGTDGGGLNRFRDGKFTSFTTKEGLSNDTVGTIYEDREGNLWMGPGGLSRFRDGKFTSYTTKEGLSNDNVRSICEDREGSLWIGTIGGGLNRLREGKFTSWTTKKGLLNDKVYSIYEDRTGSLWIGTDGGLNRFSDGKFTSYTTKEGLSNDTVDSIHEDREGTLWIGTDGGGLNRFRDGKFTSYTTKEGLSNDKVYSIYEDRAGSLWIGTDGGLNRFRDGKFTSFTTKDGLFDDAVFQILEDAQGNLWMSCNKGIFRASKKELDAFADGKLKRISCVSYGTADGMKSAECNGGTQPAGWKARDGRLWFPTIAGAVMIDPAHIPVNRLPPPVVIEEVLVDKKALGRAAAGSSIVLPPGSEKFEFHYTALSLRAPQRVKFKYRLKGFDKDWVDAGTERTAYYTHLPPRRYTFRVIACNDDGVWNEKGASIAFVVAPFFYQMRLFASLIVIAFVAVAYGAYRARVWRLKARERELLALVEERTHSLEEEKRKTEEANQAKSLFLASMSHELRTPLNVVLGFVQLIGRDRTLKAEHQEHLSIMTRSGEHLLGLINDVLSISRIEAGQLALREEAFDLSELLAGLKEVYGARADAKGLWLKVEIAPESPPRLFGDAGKLRQVLINLLENAFRLTESGGVSLLASWAEGTAEFRIEDTGPGMSEEDRARIFHVFGQTAAGERSKVGTGLGLYISRSFVQRMGGDFELTSAPGKGTCFAFRIRLPEAPSAAPESPPARVIALEPGERIFRILVADDLAENRMLLVKLFTGAGLEVREAANGLEAVEVFRSFRPDVIFMDIRMPVLDGYGATRQIREAEAREGPSARRTIIIGLSSSAFEHDREAVLEAGCDDFLSKPFRESTLFELMERHAGMKFVRESAAEAGPPVAGEPVLTRSRISTVPADLQARLKDNLDRGDLQGARETVEEIRAHDGPLGAALAESIRAYRIDRLLALLQEAAK